MKFLTDRKEIARVINIEDTPVITIKIDEPMSGYPDCYEGSKIKVHDGKSESYMSSRCHVAMFGDEPGNEDHMRPWTYKKIVLKCGCTCIHSDFGYHDVIEMEEWSNARTVKGGDRVVVLFKSERNRVCFLRLMKVSERVSRFCSTVATLVDIDD